MATTPRASADREVDYPTSDGRPMAETDLHREEMFDVIGALKEHIAADPMVYVSGNLLLFYERGNKRKRVSPDVMVVRGVPKHPPRDYYLLWQEGKSPDVVIEITAKTTRSEDQKKKWTLYRDVLKVPEHFQFDPTEDYLRPPMQGFRLVDGQYVPIEPVAGRIPSVLLGLDLERDGTKLKLHDPATGRCLLTPVERAEQAEADRARAEADRARAEADRARMGMENENLRREIEELRRRLADGP
jgi:Uma2 family endonuclease